MHVEHKNTALTLRASSHNQSLPSLNPSRFDVCTLDALSKRAVTSAAAQEAYVGCVIPECFSLDASSGAAPGATHPEIAPLLHEFADVLRSKIPGVLPPQRFAADGSAIEHCI